MEPAPPVHQHIQLNPKDVVHTLGTIIAGLVCAHLLAMLLKYGLGYDYAKGFVPMFLLHEEANVPTVFSAGLLGVGGLGFYLLDRWVPRAREGERHWLVLTGVFVFLALDEAIKLHELWVSPVRSALNTSGIFYYAWVIPYGIGIIVLGIYLLPRLLRLEREIRFLFFAAAGVYVFGAMGMEFVEGYFAGTESLILGIAVTVEESFEMIGLVTLLYAQMRLLEARSVELRIRFETG